MELQIPCFSLSILENGSILVDGESRRYAMAPANGMARLTTRQMTSSGFGQIPGCGFILSVGSAQRTTHTRRAGSVYATRFAKPVIRGQTYQRTQ